MRSFWGLSLGVLQAAAIAVLSGCSDKSSSSDDQHKVCNNLVNDGPDVHYLAGSFPAPYGTGGTILDGTYELSALTLYSATIPVPTNVVKSVISISGTSMQQIASLDGDEMRYTVTTMVQNVY